jgi:hypothetical protein
MVVACRDKIEKSWRERMVLAYRGRMENSSSERNVMSASEVVENSEVPEANRICASTMMSSNTAVVSK